MGTWEIKRVVKRGVKAWVLKENSRGIKKG